MALARRLEFAEAKIAFEAASIYAARRAAPVAETPRLEGVTIAFAGAGSPLTQVVGLGMAGPVSAAALNSIEAFYRSLGAATTIHVCPLADPSLIELLNQRPYRITEFNNVLVRPAEPAAETAEHVRVAEPSEAGLWAATVCRGFFENAPLTDAALEMTRLLFDMPHGVPWLASLDGEVRAGAGLAIHDGVGTLFADGTPPSFRRSGLQTSLIQARVRYAAAHGCDLVTAATLPGATSQHNYERLGFRVVYTKHLMTRD